MGSPDDGASGNELRIGAGARPLRRELGAMAWVVLEDLLHDTCAGGSVVRVETNVRRLSAQLGISKDTAARAMRGLHAAGLIERQGGRSASGTFAPVAYALRLDRLPGASFGTTVVKRPGRGAPETSQGTLFDAGAERSR